MLSKIQVKDILLQNGVKIQSLRTSKDQKGFWLKTSNTDRSYFIDSYSNTRFFEQWLKYLIWE